MTRTSTRSFSATLASVVLFAIGVGDWRTMHTQSRIRTDLDSLVVEVHALALATSDLSGITHANAARVVHIDSVTTRAIIRAAEASHASHLALGAVGQTIPVVQRNARAIAQLSRSVDSVRTIVAPRKVHTRHH